MNHHEILFGVDCPYCKRCFKTMKEITNVNNPIPCEPQKNCFPICEFCVNNPIPCEPQKNCFPICEFCKKPLQYAGEHCPCRLAISPTLSIYDKPIQEHGGKKYLRKIYPVGGKGSPIDIDVYCVLKAFNVTCPAIAHALKKLLCPGQRGKGDIQQDIEGAMEALWRARELAMESKDVEKGT